MRPGPAPSARCCDQARSPTTSLTGSSRGRVGVVEQAWLALSGRRGADALGDLSEHSFDLPAPEDPVFAGRPELMDRLDRDGRLVLEADDVADQMLRTEGVIAYNGAALYPHPLLAPMRELVTELLDLADDPRLAVSIALHPFRVTAVEDVPMRLLADYWSGVKVTVSNLDSLDPHDTGVRTFHGARVDAPSQQKTHRRRRRVGSTRPHHRDDRCLTTTLRVVSLVSRQPSAPSNTTR
jgi:hypothetical protein